MNKYLKEIQKFKTDMSRAVVVDLDGVITDFEHCTVGCNYTGYPERWQQLKRDQCPLRQGAVEFLTRLKNSGLKIIIYSSRIQQESKSTWNWLKKHHVPFDELVLDKPRGFCYIDDLAHEFKSFEEAEKEICARNPSSQT